jgi:NAD(P)-dependent dehydrogenase (short-subunit alcohol dehydrogenase family)
MKDFNDKVCVVTGAGSGIGRALAVELAVRGGLLAISDVNAAGLAATAAECSARGARVESFVLDVSDRAAVFAHADEVQSQFGRVNLVINNAGVALQKNVIDESIDDLEWVMSINFWGMVYGSKAFLPFLIESGDGHLVNISSLFGLIGVPGQSGYNASKFGIRGFTEALRQELLIAKAPVSVSCVHPGGIKTNIAVAARTDDPNHDELAKRFEKLARLTPQQAAAIILKGVERNKPRILVGADAKALDLMQRILGSGYQQLVARGTARATT